MKASEAVIIGSAITRQIKGALTDGNNGRCALGAMCEAAGIDMTGWAFGHPYSALTHRFPVMAESFLHPVWGTFGPLYQIVYNLNDSHGWTRERIAAYVRECEDNSENAKMTEAARLAEKREAPCQTAAT